MSNGWNDAGTVFRALGAGLSGNSDRFFREQQREKELAKQRELERQKTVFTDSLAAHNFAKEGRFDLIAQLGHSRLEMSKHFPGVDFKDTKELTTMAEAAANGDSAAASTLTARLADNVRMGQEIGVLPTPEEEQSKYLGREGGQVFMQGADGSVTAHGISGYVTPEKPQNNASHQFGAQEILKDEAGNMFFATTKRDPNTGEVVPTVVPVQGGEAEPVGRLSMVDSKGMTGSERVSQIKDEASARQDGKDNASRRTVAIEKGVDYASSVQILRRSLDLMETIKTGGVHSASHKVKNFFGVTGADEVELSTNMGRAVLAKLKPLLGAQFTAKEGEWIQRIESGFGKSTEGNIRLLKQGIVLAEKYAKRGISAARSAEDYRTAADIQDMLTGRITDEDLQGVFGVSTEQNQQQPNPTSPGDIKFLGFE